MSLTLATYKAEQFEEVKRLWERVFPDDPPRNRAEVAIPAKLAFQPELFIVAQDGDCVVGTVMAGYDGHRGWLYSLAVTPDRQGESIGAQLVQEAERRLQVLGCTKVNLQVRSTNASVARFYANLGYEVEERISMGKRIDGDRG